MSIDEDIIEAGINDQRGQGHQKADAHRLHPSQGTEQDIRHRKQRIGKAKTPVYIEFLWIEKDRRRDLDNIYSGKKYILDALQTAGVIPNDSQKYVIGLVDMVAFDKANPRVEVTICEE